MSSAKKMRESWETCCSDLLNSKTNMRCSALLGLVRWLIPLLCMQIGSSLGFGIVGRLGWQLSSIWVLVPALILPKPYSYDVFSFPTCQGGWQSGFPWGALALCPISLDLLLILRVSCKVHLCSCAAAGGGNEIKCFLHRGGGVWAWNSVKCFVLAWQFLAGVTAVPKACFNFVQI